MSDPRLDRIRAQLAREPRRHRELGRVTGIRLERVLELLEERRRLVAERIELGFGERRDDTLINGGCRNKQRGVDPQQRCRVFG